MGESGRKIWRKLEKGDDNINHDEHVKKIYIKS